MSLAAQLKPIVEMVLEPVRTALRAGLKEVALVVLAGVLGLAGGGFLLAAGLRVLSHWIGPEWALLAFGFGCLAFSGLALLGLRQPTPRPPPLPEPQPAATPDPMLALVFDVSFTLGQALRRSRK